MLNLSSLANLAQSLSRETAEKSWKNVKETLEQEQENDTE